MLNADLRIFVAEWLTFDDLLALRGVSRRFLAAVVEMTTFAVAAATAVRDAVGARRNCFDNSSRVTDALQLQHRACPWFRQTDDGREGFQRVVLGRVVLCNANFANVEHAHLARLCTAEAEVLHRRLQTATCSKGLPRTPLQSLVIDRCSDLLKPAVPRALLAFGTVQTLDINVFSPVIDISFFRMMRQLNVESLRLRGGGSGSFDLRNGSVDDVTVLPHLHTFGIHNMDERLSGEVLATLLEMMPSITALELVACVTNQSQLTDACFGIIAEAAAQLQRLDLRRMARPLTATALARLAPLASTLTVLDLSQALRTSTDALTAVCALQKLEELRMQRIPNMDAGATVPLLLASLPRLSSLDLSMNHVPGHVWPDVAQAANLKRLRFVGGNTDDGLALLRLALPGPTRPSRLEHLDVSRAMTIDERLLRRFIVDCHNAKERMSCPPLPGLDVSYFRYLPAIWEGHRVLNALGGSIGEHVAVRDALLRRFVQDAVEAPEDLGLPLLTVVASRAFTKSTGARITAEEAERLERVGRVRFEWSLKYC